MFRDKLSGFHRDCGGESELGNRLLTSDRQNFPLSSPIPESTSESNVQMTELSHVSEFLNTDEMH